MKQILFLLLLIQVYYIQCQQPTTLSQNAILTYFNEIFQTNKTNLDEIVDSVKDFDFLQNVIRDDLFFYYYEPSGSNKTKQLSMDQAVSLLETLPNVTIIVHGWQNTGNYAWVVNMSDTFHKNTEKQYNILALDWSKYSLNLNYIKVAQNVQSVANYLGEFLIAAHQKNKDILENVHLIGHSFGAHVVGVAGYYVQQAGLTLPWITGLDPAAPLFTLLVIQPDSKKLVADHARFVDIIHSSKILVGYTLPRGKVDFYPNYGGPIQPSCQQINIVSAVTCSHKSSAIYYTATINEPDVYIGSHCEDDLAFTLGLCKSSDQTPMGFHVPKCSNGTYYLNIKYDNLKDITELE